MDKRDFSKRLTELRLNKGVSARDMSLSLGQSEGYINNIENGVNLPSMTVFFYICEYFGIEPYEFFETENTNPTRLNELISTARSLNNEQLESLITIIKSIK
jgi:transcriptional regulator with XRE-family HTH domain